MKTCSKCHISKDGSEFYKGDPRKGGLSNYCKGCYTSYYAQNKNRIVERQRRYRKTEEGKLLCRKRQSNYYKLTRLEFLQMYGKRCSCCGDSRECFLTLDHITPLRYRGKRSFVEYKKALKSYRPDLYQVLCFNCNCLKGDKEKCPCRGVSYPGVQQ
jgi:hypothetical protein